MASVGADVCAVLADVLGLPSVDPAANFFELGGDSIQAVRFVASLRRHGLEVDVATVYRSPTLAHLAAHLAPTGRSGGTDPGYERRTLRHHPTRLRPFALLTAAERGILPADAVDAFPATRMQRAMFLHNALDAHVYQHISHYELDTVLEQEPLHAALTGLLRAHPALRSSFLLEGADRPLQVVHRRTQPEVTVVDLGPVDTAQMRAHVDAWALDAWIRPFDLDSPGLLRVHLHRTVAAGCTLSLAFHHAIVDGRSEAHMISEILRRYVAAQSGAAVPEPRDDTALGCYVALERRAEQSDVHRAFWRDYLDDVTPSVLARPRPAPPAGAPTVQVCVPMAQEVAERFERLARAAGVPPRTAYLTAYLVLLAFASGRPEVLGGLVVNSRLEDDGGDEAVGLFLNTVPVRAVIDDRDFGALLAAVWAEESTIVQHRRLPYDQIQAEARVGTLCPSVFNYSDFRGYRESPANGPRLTAMRLLGETNFDLAVTVDQDPLTGTPVIFLTGRSDRFDEPEVRRYGRILEQVIVQAATAQHEPVARALAAWAEAQGEATVVAPGSVANHPSSALGLVVDRLRTSPDDLAQVAGPVRMTIAELAGQACDLRDQLVRAGVRPGTRIACFLRRGPDPLVVMLGVWAAGGCYVPIDPGLPLSQQQQMLTRAACTLAVRPAGVDPSSIAWTGVEVVPARTGAAADLASWAEPAGDAEAYILFTSGSTGMPKAVSIPHGAVGNLISWQIGQPEYALVSRVTEFSAVSFDVSIRDMLASVACGATLFVIPDEVRVDPRGLLDHLVEHEIETLYLPTVMLPQLAAAWEAGAPTPTALRYVSVGGEALVLTDPVRRFLAAVGAGLINGYGPTEATVLSTYHQLGSDPERWPDRPSIGPPLQNVTLKVLDPLRRPVLRGVTGELYIGGAGLARGYLDDDVADRFVTVDGERYYRTGDLVREDDGQLEFVGRADHQVKIRGHRVEPDGVAAALMTCADVRDCVVRAVTAGDGGAVLVAYVVPTAAGTTSERILADARGLLPAHSVPSGVVLLDRLPMNRHGKVDMGALPLPQPSRGAGDGHVTQLERQVLEVWEQVLGVAVADPTVSFADAGGNSLMLLPLYLRLRRRFDREVPMRELLALPTARDIATVVSDLPPAGSTSPADEGAVAGEPAAPDADEQWLPLTPVQEGMWLDSQLAGSSSVRNLAVAITLRGDLDVNRLGRSWTAVVQAHPALRATFVNSRGVLRQRLPAGHAPLPSPAVHEVPPEELRTMVETAVRTPIRLTSGQPCQVSVFRANARHHVLVLVLHHIVGDLGTLRLLLDDLAAAYAADGAAARTDVDRYAEAVLAAQGTRRPDPEVIAFWRRRIPADASMLPVSGRGSTAPLATHWSEHRFSAEQRDRVHRLARLHSVSPALVLVSGLCAALRPVVANDQLVIAMPVSTRNDRRWAGTAGLFLDTLPLVVDRPSPEAEFADVVAMVGERFAESLPRMVPFPSLVAAVRPARSAASVPLLEISFNYLSSTLAPPSMPGLDVALFPLDHREGRFPLAVYCDESADGMRVRIGGQLARLTASQVEALASGLAAAVTRGVADGVRAGG